MPAPSRLGPDALLAHAGFLEGLAARLVADPASADDVVQTTYLAALEHPPEARHGARSWLATVARNAARALARGARRRGARERRAARPEGVPTPTDVREREQARRVLVAAVLRLDEVYRDVVLLRFYEDLPPREVARRLDVPVETVRTRVRRAVLRLRADLDREHGRGRWAPALLPLASAWPGGAAGASTLGTVVAMSTQGKLLWTAAALLLLLCGAWGIGWVEWPPRDTGDPVGEVSIPAGADPAETPRLSGRPPAQVAPAPESSPAGDDGSSRAGRPSGVLRGFVFRGRTGEPVVDARITAKPTRGGLPGGRMLPAPGDLPRIVSTDAQGRFTFDDVPVGAWALVAEHPEAGRGESVAVAGLEPPWALLHLEPDEPQKRVLEVRVRSMRDDPVAGAEIVVGTNVWSTDSAGSARLDDFGLGSAVRSKRWASGNLTVRTPDARVEVPFAFDQALRWAGPYVLDVRLSGGRLEGRVHVPAGVSPTGRAVVATFGTTGATVEAAVAPDGSFRTADTLPEGRYALDVRSGDGLRLDVERLPDDRRTYVDAVGDFRRRDVEVRWGAATEVDLRLVPGGILRGRVKDATGAPLAGAKVDLHLPSRRPESWATAPGRPQLIVIGGAGYNPPGDPSVTRAALSGPDGGYEIRGLLPGEYRLELTGPAGFSDERSGAVRIEDGRTQELVHTLVRGGALELLTASGSYFELRRAEDAGAPIALQLWSECRGALTVPGLIPGDWILVQRGMWGAGPSEPAAPLARFVIRAGETTFLDATQAGAMRLRVQLLDGGRPVPGARVDGGGFAHATLVTDQEGRVAWRLPLAQGPASHVVRIAGLGTDRPDLVARFDSSGDEVRLELPSGRLVARALDADDQGTPGAGVRLRARNQPDRSPWGLLRDWAVFRTDAQGRVAVRGLPHGDYEVRVVFPSGAASDGRVTIGAEPAEIALREPPSGRLHVRVVDAGGRPVEGAYLRVGVIATRPGAPPPAPDAVAVDHHDDGLVTGPDGTCVVPGVAPGWVRIRAWFFDARGGAATLEAGGETELVAGQTRSVELRLGTRDG